MKNHIYNYLGLLTITSTVAVAGAAPAQAIVLDEFTTPQSVTADESNSPQSNTVTFFNSDLGIDLDRTITADVTQGTGETDVEIDRDGLDLGESNTDTNAAGTTELTYTRNGGGSIDLANQQSFKINFRSVSSPEAIDTTFGVTDTNSSATSTKEAPQGANTSTRFDVSEFSGIDFSQVQEVSINFDYTESGTVVGGADLSAKNANAAVPYEMETGFGLAAAAALFGYRKFRKSRAKRQNNAVAE